MKLKQLLEMNSDLGPMEHAFWQKTSGPNRTPGESLHYIEDAAEWGAHLRSKSKNSGDERWIRGIEQMHEKGQFDKGKYTHPSFGWWMSKESFEKGEDGFGGGTKENVMRDNPNLKIHDSKEEALKAAGY